MAYRLKHIPSGLYYTPSRDVVVRSPQTACPAGVPWRIKSNLSKTGKLYLTEAKAGAAKNNGSFYDHTRCMWEDVEGREVARTARRPMFADEWIVEEV